MPDRITLEYWWVGALTYAFCHIAHLVIWHFRILKPGLRLLFVLFYALPAASYLAFLLLGGDFWISFAPAFAHGALSAQYFGTYPAIQASSPTLVILDALYRAPAGLTEEEVNQNFAHRSLVEDRLKDLLSAHLITPTDRGHTLTTRGNLFVSLFILLRKILGYPPGQG